MSRVYLALVRGPGDFNKLQVIKRLLPTLASDPEFLEMFLEEARLSARLNHANIVQINEVGFDGAHHFMAMEYLEGQSLDTIVRRAARDGGFSVAMHLRVIADACSGLHHAHDLTDIDGRPLNIVHRDVSPHNVFVTYAGQVKVLDFGIAKAADSSHHTRTGVLKGKCAYMAPEQFKNEAITRRADIFALGVMLWQAVTQQRLWKGLTDIEIFHRLATGDIPSPLTVDPTLPPELVAICERALAPKLEHRYSTAAELGEAIENYLAILPDMPANRDIGKCVADMFADSRQKVREAIEAELQRSEVDDKSTAEVPIFVDTNLPSEDDETAALGPNSAWPSSSPQIAAPGESYPIGTAGEAPPPALRALKTFVAVGLALVLVLAGIIVVLSSRSSEKDSATATSPSQPDSTTNVQTQADPPSVREHISLSIEAQPRSAKLYVDGVQVSSNPGTANFLRDGVAHEIRAEAPGYQTESETIFYDQAERSVQFNLEREVAGKPSWVNVHTTAATGKRKEPSTQTTNVADEPAAPPAIPIPPPRPNPHDHANKPKLDTNPWGD